MSARYCKKNKERIQKKSCERYQNLSKEEKNKKQEYGHKQYKNVWKTEKQKLVEYRKKNIVKCKNIKGLMSCNITKNI